MGSGCCSFRALWRVLHVTPRQVLAQRLNCSKIWRITSYGIVSILTSVFGDCDTAAVSKCSEPHSKYGEEMLIHTFFCLGRCYGNSGCRLEELIAPSSSPEWAIVAQLSLLGGVAKRVEFSSWWKSCFEVSMSLPVKWRVCCCSLCACRMEVAFRMEDLSPLH
jgi:hypothetical protein